MHNFEEINNLKDKIRVSIMEIATLPDIQEELILLKETCEKLFDEIYEIELELSSGYINYD